MAVNHLAFGDLLVDRLIDTVDSVGTVLASIEQSGLTEASFITPALHVYYVSEDFGDVAALGRAHEIKQTWSVRIVTKNLKLPSPRLAELGGIITDVLNSLQGWKASPSYSALCRVPAPGPKNDPGGYTHFPLYFSTKFLTTGDSNGY